MIPPAGDRAPSGVSVESTPPPELRSAAVWCFGDRLPVAVQFAEILMTDGVVRGLIGPRELDRLWDRHLLNCAIVAELIPSRAHVVDVGSGAGLPGVVLAVARPDLSVDLVEPLARRAGFLSEVVVSLGLDRTTVVRARAEECGRRHPQLEPANVVTARAVASLDRLARWCLPLTAEGGRLLALKGESASDEIATHRAAISRAGGGEPVLLRCGEGILPTPTTVVEITKVGRVRPLDRR